MLPKYIEADVAIKVDVGMVDLSSTFDFGRFVGIWLTNL